MANIKPVIKPFSTVKDGILIYGRDTASDKNVRMAVDISGALQTSGGGGGGGGDVVVTNFQDLSGVFVNVANFPPYTPSGSATDVSATIVNWLDASGLYVHVTNPSSAVDISGQYVTTNGLCPIVTNWLPYGTLNNGYPAGDVLEYGVEFPAGVDSGLFLGKEIYALDNSGVIVHLGTAFNYNVLDYGSLGMKPYLIDNLGYTYTNWGLAPEYNVIKPLLQDQTGQLVVSLPDVIMKIDQLIGSSNRYGTIQVTSGSTTVLGYGTVFTAQVSVGDIIYLYSSELAGITNIGTVASVESDTSLTLTGNPIASTTQPSSWGVNSPPVSVTRDFPINTLGAVPVTFIGNRSVDISGQMVVLKGTNSQNPSETVPLLCDQNGLLLINSYATTTNYSSRTAIVDNNALNFYQVFTGQRFNMTCVNCFNNDSNPSGPTTFFKFYNVDPSGILVSTPPILLVPCRVGQYVTLNLGRNSQFITGADTAVYVRCVTGISDTDNTNPSNFQYASFFYEV